MLKINYIEFSPTTKSMDIFVSGCNKPYCKDCCNPELIDFNNGTDWKEWKEQIEYNCTEFGNLFDNIFLLGGSFNHQDDEDLAEIIPYLSNLRKNLWLFAREQIEDIKPIFKTYCEYIKIGEYIPEYRCGDNIQYGVTLSTSNQAILKKLVNY